MLGGEDEEEEEECHNQRQKKLVSVVHSSGYVLVWEIYMCQPNEEELSKASPVRLSSRVVADSESPVGKNKAESRERGHDAEG